jgi:hypothetical protein
VAEPDEWRRLAGEHPAARPRPHLDQAPRLEQADRLVHGRDRDPEALAQLLLGADPLAGAERPGEDLGRQVAGERLGPRDARFVEVGLEHSRPPPNRLY